MYRADICMGAPTLRPMAVQMTSSKMRRPSDETGGALSHAPDLTEASTQKAHLRRLISAAGQKGVRWMNYQLVPRLLPRCVAVGRGVSMGMQGILSCTQGHGQVLSPCESTLTNGWVGALYIAQQNSAVYVGTVYF